MAGELIWQTEDGADTIEAGGLTLTVEPDVDEADRGREGWLWCVQMRQVEWDALAEGKAPAREVARRAALQASPAALRARAEKLRQDAEDLERIAGAIEAIRAH